MNTKSNFFRIMSLILILFVSTSCEKAKDQPIPFDQEEMIDAEFLTEKFQSQLTPDFVLDILKKRNKEFVDERLTIRNTSQRIRTASLGQYPGAVILSCLDSRVPVEDVFHSGIGDLFVARVAGNISNEDIIGSLEFACKVSGAKVVVVLGHEHCGAIKSAINNVELGNITALLAKIKPAIAAVQNFKGEKTSKNPDYLEAVTQSNINETISNIRKNSPILKEMEEKGEIKIIGGEYHMETGNVEFIK
ncbi:carbonic anhydrase [Chryseobacterium carnipullorum]|nr:carbonic anhydrase [Chryseobacterium carnipullorum]